jgi:hypothetical protein
MPRRRRTKHQEANVDHAEYLAWIHDQPCCVCGTMQNIEAAHVGQGGVGMKHGSDAEVIPLCGPHLVFDGEREKKVKGVVYVVTDSHIARGCHAEHDQFTGYFKGWKLSRRREWDEQQVAIHRGRFEAFSAGRGAVA